KAVAERYVNWKWTVDNHPQISHIKKCAESARSNLRLGRWVEELSPRGKLLQPELHHVFNAAIILLLHELLFDSQNESDASDVIFAIQAFGREASCGNNYGYDCAKVLSDLRSLIGG